MSDVSTAGHWLQVFAPAVGWGIVIIGWIYVARDNDAREQRKEVRALLNEIGKYIMEIEELAYKYYALPASSSQEEGKRLKRDIKRLASRISTLKNINKEFDLNIELNDYRQVITGRDFDTSHRPERMHNDAIYHEISDSAVKLNNAMENLYAKSYKSRMN